MRKMEKSSRKARNIIIGALVIVIAGAGVSGVMYWRNTAKSDNVIYEILDKRVEAVPGVRINSVDISGKTLEEAQAIMKDAITPHLGSITIVNGDKEQLLDLSSLIPQMNMDEVVVQAMEYGNTADSLLNAQQTEEARSKGKNFETTNTYDLSALQGQIDAIAQALYVAPVDATMVIPGKIKEDNSDLAYDPSEVLDSDSSIELDDDEGKVSDIVQDHSLITIDSNGVAQGFESLFVYEDAVPGEKVDSSELYNTINEALQNGTLVDNARIEAPVTEIPAEIQKEDIEQKFDLLSEKTSSFAKSNYSKANRVYNINKAAEIINGYILEPGEEFSFNTVLGPRVAKYGWKAAGAISNGKSVQETGGGICQVSSTAYNAVLMADLEIVERNPHSWPLSYIESGQDATISTGGPDFIFKNSREKPVVMVAFVNLDNKTLTIQFYGEKSTEYDEIRIVSEQTGTIKQPATQYITSGETRSGRSGSKWKTHLEYVKDGEVVKTKDAPSTTYRAIAALSYKSKPAAAVPAESVQNETAAETPSTPAETTAPVQEESSNSGSDDSTFVEEADIPIE